MAEEKKELSEEILNEVNGGNETIDTGTSIVQLTCPNCGKTGNHMRYTGARVRCLSCGAVYVA